MSNVECFLKCVDNSHDPIPLPDGKEVILGRGPETRIKESRCSRHQVKLVANYLSEEVIVTQVGRNSCAVNGTATKKDVPVTVKHGDKIGILLGKFINQIDFKLKNEETPEPETPSTAPRSSIRLSDSEDEEPLAKKLELSDSSKWEKIDNGKLWIYTHDKVVNSNLIAAYDLDGTLIATNSGSRFAKNVDDWKILYPQVITKLKDLFDSNYKILIFTNQAGLSNGKISIKDFKGKIQEVVKKLGVPVQVFIATDNSIYRKPCPGMWDTAMQKNNNLTVDMTKSFYCGDAAGRDSHNKKDFSQTDLLFALNLKLPFYTPEHHFLKKKMEKTAVSVFDPNKIPVDLPLCTPEYGVIHSVKLEMVLLVGSPGSGKTTFYENHMKSANYVHVNRDTLGSMSNCLKAAKDSLAKGQNVVVDNTNPDPEARKLFINLGKTFTGQVRCFIMNTTPLHAKHNNKFRQITNQHAVAEIIINNYFQKYVEPSLDEGFSEILKINFWPMFERGKNSSRLYNMFLLEKS